MFAFSVYPDIDMSHVSLQAQELVKSKLIISIVVMIRQGQQFQSTVLDEKQQFKGYFLFRSSEFCHCSPRCYKGSAICNQTQKLKCSRMLFILLGFKEIDCVIS